MLGTTKRRVEPRADVRVPWYRRPVTIVALAAFAVVAVVAPVALLGRDEGATTNGAAPTSLTQVETTLTEVDTSPTTLPVATTPVMPSEVAMVWERIDTAPVFERAWMRAVAVGGPGLVAVGSTEQQGAAIWTSDDGKTWQRVEVDGLERLEGEEERYLSDVAAGPNGVVAIGGINGADADHDGAMTLHSTDGISWYDTGNSAALEAVATAPQGFIAIGQTMEAPQVWSVWSSDDGTEWENVDHPSLAASLAARPGFEAPYLADIVAGGPGFVAVGCEVPLESEFSPSSDAARQAWMNRNPAIWVSPDGVTWERLADGAVVDPQIELQSPTGATAGIPTCIASVISTDTGLLALGDWGDRVWTSSDGYSWTISQDFAPTDQNEPIQLEAIAADDGRVVATGQGPSLEHINGDQPPWYGSAVFWASDDADGSWHRVGLLEAINRVGMVDTVNMPYATPSVGDDIVAFNGGFVAVGHAAHYSSVVDEALAENWCGFEGEETGSCRTDAAVWIGKWRNP